MRARTQSWASGVFRCWKIENPCRFLFLPPASIFVLKTLSPTSKAFSANYNPYDCFFQLHKLGLMGNSASLSSALSIQTSIASETAPRCNRKLILDIEINVIAIHGIDQTPSIRIIKVHILVCLSLPKNSHTEKCK